MCSMTKMQGKKIFGLLVEKIPHAIGGSPLAQANVHMKAYIIEYEADKVSVDEYVLYAVM